MPWATMRRLGWFRVLVVAELLVASNVAGGLWLMRAQILDNEGRTLASLARASALQADRSLGIGITLLKTCHDELTRGLIPATGPDTDALLKERVRAQPGFRTLRLVDATGQALAGSSPPPPGPPGAGLRRGLEAARQASGPTVVLHDGAAAPGAAEPAMLLSMGWRRPDGALAGLIALGAEADFLDGGFAQVAGDDDLRRALFRADGRLLSARPEPEGTAPGATPMLQQLPALRQVPTPVRQGGHNLWVVAVPLTQLPLVQVVWRDQAELLAGWTELAWLAGGILAAMLGLTLAVGLRMGRAQLRVQALEAQLARKRMLEGLGQLAGGVAHDFNNVLAAVVGYGELAQQQAAPGSRQAGHLAQVLRAAERGRQQVARVLAFSRGQPRRQRRFELQPVLQEVVDHLGLAQRPGIALSLQIAGPPRVLLGDPTALYQAVMNLCTNALQAMPAGGRLQLRLEDTHLPTATTFGEATLPAGHYLRIQVIDSGQGLSAEVRAHLFEPFFTTKGHHGGTGIGLAVVHGVVADLGGAVDVASSPGQGCCFTLLLPASDGPAEAEAAPLVPLPLGQGQTVLVVDDEPDLVALAEEMLAELGYEPLGTTRSADALAALQAEPRRFDLLLTDAVMPGLSGTDLARAARALRPDLPVLLLSGHGGPQFDARASDAGVSAVLAKPLTRAELARAVHLALHPGPGAMPGTRR